MPIVGLRQLSRETREVIDQLEQDGEPVVVTRHGKPIAALTAVSEERAAALALAVVPDHLARRERAEQEISAGDGEPASRLLAELEAEDDEHSGGEPDVVEVPMSLVEEVGRAAVRDLGVSTELIASGQLPAQYFEYVRAVLRSSVRSGFERVRTVNQNILEEASLESGELSREDYVGELESAAAAETLALRPPRVR